MTDRRNQRLGKFLASSKIIFLISLVVLIFFSINLAREIINRRDLQKDISALQSEIDVLQQRNSELGDLISYFDSLDFVEEEARTKLNLRKPGETILIVPENNETGEAAPLNQAEYSNITSQKVVTYSNPERWWNYFFNLENYAR